MTNSLYNREVRYCQEEIRYINVISSRVKLHVNVPVINNNGVGIKWGDVTKNVNKKYLPVHRD